MSTDDSQGWRHGAFDSFITLQRGFDLPVQDRIPGKIPVFASNGQIGTHNEARINGPSVVTGRSGTIGKVLFSPAPSWPLNTTLYVKDFHGNDARFVCHFLRFFQLNRFGTGTGVPTLNRNDVHRQQVSFPPLPEQHRIAEVLSSVDEAIEATQAVIEQTRKVKQGVLERLLTKGIGPKRFVASSLGSVPSGWVVKPLGSVVTLSGGTGFPIKYQGSTELPFPFIKVSDMNLPGNEKHIRTWNNTIDAGIAKALRGKPFPFGAVVFPKVGAALLTNKRRILKQPTFVDNNVMAATPGPEITSEYLYHWLCQIDFGNHVQPGAVPSINQQQVGALPILLPPLEEQEAISLVLCQFDETLEALERGAHACRVTKSSLMSDLLIGRKRVTDTMALAAE